MERIRPKKAFGQHFLTDPAILGRIVAAADLTPSDLVLEVGPGRGALTRLLADRARQVVAVELDRELLSPLEQEFAALGNVAIIGADILAVDLPTLLGHYGECQWQVVANLPYNISSQVLLRFLDHRQLFPRLVLMLQREVGERLIASPGTTDYGILSLFCALHYEMRRELIVRPGAFHPPPRVDSMVLRFDRLAGPREDVGDEVFFRRLVKAAFGQRRKTLGNALRSAALVPDTALMKFALDRAGIDPVRRGETLALAEFACLSRELLAVRGS